MSVVSQINSLCRFIYPHGLAREADFRDFHQRFETERARIIAPDSGQILFGIRNGRPVFLRSGDRLKRAYVLMATRLEISLYRFELATRRIEYHMLCLLSAIDLEVDIAGAWHERQWIVDMIGFDFWRLLPANVNSHQRAASHSHQMVSIRHH